MTLRQQDAARSVGHHGACIPDKRYHPRLAVIILPVHLLQVTGRLGPIAILLCPLRLPFMCSYQCYTIPKAYALGWLTWQGSPCNSRPICLSVSLRSAHHTVAHRGVSLLPHRAAGHLARRPLQP